ncbi:serine/threonine-protein kinase [Paludibaculum fermentans]|uniref:Protein kinase n=1 Tax=Paludibaculum fermentans TaxID=1473598 RepID=A0A7S7SJU8_PALFE|nr:serine/threonine-protein kinase [Paludibaculum fermentans]QOY87624.1 protein kinase [Paludibaculum fermentans]
MHPPVSGRSRYELREVLGRGGMGVVYKAYDTLMHREVALKTILDVQSKAALDLFYREWGLQASITHPNIAEIYDIGEMQHEGAVRPYFVMPLLPGTTLTELIRTSSARLTIDRALGILTQVCRGLQAAHDRGLIHRDLKPSNVFVLEDDSVRIIDFGIAHVETSAQTSVRGTLAYMAPELLQMKPASVASDIFALGVLSYESLTRRRPFEGSNDAELSRAILYSSPHPISELVQGVPLNVSRTIHKAMAKQPWHRYASAREFGETLIKAQRGEPIDFFDSAKVLPRVERASRAYERGEYQVATEILNELECEGHIEQEILLLRRQVEQTQRQLTVRGFLDSARRFAEEEEFALSLRKVQEALDLDPENTDAQALRNEVEKQRRARKIEEWAALAKKHLENNAFTHARTALQSLLELRPNEPNALALLAEIQRKEQEFEKIRQEKSRLVASARDAWQRGEVTSALTNLEKWVNLDGQAPETDAERMVSLQSFYKQVRGEHEALKNSYDKARHLLSEGDHAGSLAICNQYLAKYPGHALFQALKFDVEERQRQNLSAYIAETDRRVDNEADLDRRVAVLEEALRQHPGESHFERALKLTRDKRDLVSSVASRARLHEDEGRFGEALDQWEVLRAIHASFPGLEYEIDRVQKRRDSQALVDARSGWIRQIDHHIEARDFTKAAASASQALAEFPGDQELIELRKMADEKYAQVNLAVSLLEQGRAVAAEGQPEAALELLHKAYQTDRDNPMIRSALVNALALRAKNVADTDPTSADELVGQILKIDPGHTIGLNLRALRADKKKEEFIGWCTAQARKLQAAGDLEGAIVIVQEGLSKYPNDARLNQLYTTLDRTQGGIRKMPQPPPLPAPPPPAAAAPGPPPPVVPPKPGPAPSVPQPPTRVPTMAPPVVPPPPGPGGNVPPPLPVQSPPVVPPPPSAAVPLPPQASVNVPPTPPLPPPGPGVPPLPVTERPIAGKSPLPAEPAVPPTTVISPVAPPTVLKSQAPPPPPAKPSSLATLVNSSKTIRYGLVGAAALILIASVAAIFKKAQPVGPVLVKVEVRTTPQGAKISISDQDRGVSNLKLDLTPGEYRAAAELEGYQPTFSTFTVRPGAPIVVDLTLLPWKPAVRVVSEAEVTQATLSGQTMNPGAPGEYAVDSLGEGSYQLRIVSPKGEVSAGLQLSPRSVATLAGPIQVKDLGLMLVNQYLDRVVIYYSDPTSKVSLDGQPAQPVPVDGLSINGVKTGAHTVNVEVGTTTRTLTFTMAQTPIVQAFVLGKAEADMGTILVKAGEENVSVTINGYPHYLKTRQGQVRLVSIKPGTYKLAIAKDGFEVPPAQNVEVKKGEEAIVEFKLKQIAKLATAKIQGAPGAQLFIDGQAAGSLAPDGTFSVDVAPGSHSFELHRGTAKSKPVTRDFKSGETVQVAVDLPAQQVNGTVRFEVTPSDATLTIRRANEPESQARPVSQNPLSLPEGSYIVFAASPKHTSSVANLNVQNGVSQTLTLSLRALEDRQPKKAAETHGLGDFDDPNGWSNEGEWNVRKGGKYVTYRLANTAAVFQFQIQQRKGKRLQWFLHYTDSRNHVLFRLDKTSFSRVLVAGGKSTDQARIEHHLQDTGTYEVRITVDSDRIVHELRNGDRWVVVDSYSEKGVDLAAGKFGFYVPESLIPGHDEYGVKKFTMVTKPR